MTDDPPCAFCGKTQAQVRRLILNAEGPERPQFAICDECVFFTAQILASESAAMRDELFALLQDIEPLNSN